MLSDSPSQQPATASLLSEPHHDTGPAYLLGERVPGAVLTARLWVPADLGVQRVVLRQVIDAEPVVPELTAVETTQAGSWWEGPVRLVNQINRYRFLLLAPGTDTPYMWYHAAGLSDHDVPDSTDFQVLAAEQAPVWVKDAVVYQIFPDRFACSSADPFARPHPDWTVPHAWDAEPPVRGEPTGTAWYGGDLDGIASHLDWLESLGVNTVYLTPVFPAGSTHRYDSITFDDVDQLLGGQAALARLSEAVHARGMRFLLDLTTNHTGVTHEWFQTAITDPDSEEAGFYSFTEYPEKYAAWLDVPSLPKLDHRSPELRRRLLQGEDSVVGRWLLPPVNADGWRVDVANMTGRLGQVDLAHQVAADMRQTMEQISEKTGRPLWLLAEHGHDATPDLTGPGWHGTMNYASFTRPLWSWLSDPDPADGLTWLGIPTELPHLPGEALVRGIREYDAHMSYASLSQSMNLLCSHDTPRIRTVVGNSRELQLVAATALFGAPGTPTVFMGDELGATGITGEHSRTTIPWENGPSDTESDALPHAVGDTGAWGPVDHQVTQRYRQLIAKRHELPALRCGGTRFIHADSDLVIWVRTHPEGDVLVALARAAHPELQIALSDLFADSVHAVNAFDGCTVEELGVSLVLSFTGPGSAVVELH